MLNFGIQTLPSDAHAKGVEYYHFAGW